MPVLATPKAMAFVVGLHRSGTSLLYALLNQHPAIGLMYEADFLASSVRRGSKSWLLRAEFLNQALSRHDLTPNDSMINARTVYEAFADRKQATVCGEKSPVYATRLLRIHELFPDAQLILIRRNLAETYGSVLDAGREDRFFSRRGMLARLLWAERRMERDAAELQRRGAPVTWVEYAELVAQPEKVCRGLCHFLNLPFSKRMCSLEGADLSAVWDAPHHRRLKAGVIARREQQRILPIKASRLIQQVNAIPKEASGQSRKATGGATYRRYLAVGGVLHRADKLKDFLLRVIPYQFLRFYRFIEAPPKHQGMQRYPEFEDPDSWSAGFAKIKRIAIGLFSAAILLFVAWIDYLTWRSFTLAPFYFLPITIATLGCGRRAGLHFSFLAAILWTLTNPPQHPHPQWVLAFLMFWNISMRFSVLAVYAFLVDRIRRSSHPSLRAQ